MIGIATSVTLYYLNKYGNRIINLLLKYGADISSFDIVDLKVNGPNKIVDFLIGKGVKTNFETNEFIGN